jgi:hypothetical protein
MYVKFVVLTAVTMILLSAGKLRQIIRFKLETFVENVLPLSSGTWSSQKTPGFFHLLLVWSRLQL